jgi:hypothetical protein
MKPLLTRLACRLAPVLAPVAMALMSVGISPSAQADDRPFLRTTSAIVEDDDERVFEWSLSHTNGKKERNTQTQLGYSFSPTLSVELEWAQARDKVEGLSSREHGLGLWVSWVDPARAGWGLASKFSVERERENGSPWEHPAWKGVLAYSLPLADKSTWLHANWGMRYLSSEGDARRWNALWSVAAQTALNRRFELFAELAGNQERSDQLAMAGVRHWIKREKWALDVGLGRQLAEDRKGPFLAVSLSVFDISP